MLRFRWWLRITSSAGQTVEKFKKWKTGALVREAIGGWWAHGLGWWGAPRGDGPGRKNAYRSNNSSNAWQFIAAAKSPAGTRNHSPRTS